MLSMRFIGRRCQIHWPQCVFLGFSEPQQISQRSNEERDRKDAKRYKSYENHGCIWGLAGFALYEGHKKPPKEYDRAVAAAGSEIEPEAPARNVLDPENQWNCNNPGCNAGSEDHKCAFGGWVFSRPSSKESNEGRAAHHSGHQGICQLLPTWHHSLASGQVGGSSLHPRFAI